MHLMTQTKNGISAVALSRQLSVSCNTAWKVKHKLMQVMKKSDDARPPGGWAQLDDAYWGGQRRGGNPGEERRARRQSWPPWRSDGEGRPMKMRLSRVGGFRSEKTAARARCPPEPGAVVVSDALGCVGAVQQAGCFTSRS